MRLNRTTLIRRMIHITALKKRPENNFQFTDGRWKFSLSIVWYVCCCRKSAVLSRQIFLFSRRVKMTFWLTSEALTSFSTYCSLEENIPISLNFLVNSTISLFNSITFILEVPSEYLRSFINILFFSFLERE